jgi:hypothetical protein
MLPSPTICLVLVGTEFFILHISIRINRNSISEGLRHTALMCASTVDARPPAKQEASSEQAQTLLPDHSKLLLFLLA